MAAVAALGAFFLALGLWLRGRAQEHGSIFPRVDRSLQTDARHSRAS